jgi:small-conductance mechanosensitive channel
LTSLFRVFHLPLPLFRLYVMLVAVGGFGLCLWRAAVNARRGAPFWQVWALRLWTGVLAVVFVAELGGYNALATHLLEASIHTTFAVMIAWLLALLARGGIELALGTSSLLWRIPFVQRNAAVIGRSAGFWADVLVAFLALSVILQAWRMYEGTSEALQGLLSLGITVGGRHITAGLVLTAVAVLYGAFLSSWAIQDMLMNEVYPRRRVDWGVRYSMNRLAHYAIVLVGFLIALGLIGVELQNITILAGAFGIGIGFGLQDIVHNFVSGLILLFERPVKVGDMIQIGGEWGHIRKVGLRATVVQTLDKSEVIVPNSDLISNPVTNWTFSDRYARLILPVGVAYGSDVALTMKILQEIAEDNSTVLSDPEPQVFFIEFGDSSLNFELRAWIPDIETRFTVRSELHQEVDRRFRKANVEIAFPQRDLHLRTVDQRARKTLAEVVPPAASDARGKDEVAEAKPPPA